MTFRKIVTFLAIFLIFLCFVWLIMLIWPETAMSKAISAYERSYINSTQSRITMTSTENTVLPKVISTLEIVPTLTVPKVTEYILDSSVDLSSGNPISLTIDLSNGDTLNTNWAGTLPYSHTDNLDSVFAPEKGVVYSYLGDVTATWAHSGMNSLGQKYFATELDIYLRKKPGNTTMTLAESNATAESLKGAEAFLCQVDSGTVELLSDYTYESCPGKVVQLEIVAVAIIPREKVDEFKTDPVNVNMWLVKNFPTAGFDQLSKDNGWLISFCVGKFADQTSDGTPSYLYNRGVIGFRVKDGSS